MTESNKKSTEIIWDRKITKELNKRVPIIRIASYSNQAAGLTLSRKAVELILGDATDGSIMIGLNNSTTHLYIKPCQADEAGSRYISTETDIKLSAHWLGSKLNINNNIVYSGILIKGDNDMLSAELIENTKIRRNHSDGK